ncbi:MAG TPA: PP0621 family protein [Rhodocyclaceae bacterium]
MGKLFLFILLGTLAYLLLKRGQAPKAKHSPPAPPAAEPMVQCAQCRVHLPLSESIADGDRRYCCEEHRALGRR